MTRQNTKTIVFLLLGCFLYACGQAGPLYLPEERKQTKATAQTTRLIPLAGIPIASD